MTPEDKQSVEFREWLRSHLRVGPLTVTFTKADGTERVMKCTTNFEYIPEEFHPKGGEVEVKEKEDIDLVKCFDIESNGWRSFKPTTLTNVEFNLGD